MTGDKDSVTPGIYVKLPSGTWVKIQGKLERLVRTSRKGRGKPKTSVAYTLIGKSLDNPPKKPSGVPERIYVSSSRITKLIIKLLDEIKIDKEIILVWPRTKETYVIEIYYPRRAIVDRIRKLAEELKILRQIKEKPVGSSLR